MSLYNNFSSKDELIVAYLDRRHAEWLGLLEERTQRARSAIERVLDLLFLLVEGGVVSAGVEGNPEPLQRARRLAQLLLSGK
jgi:AcrR family transcriptional regulator